MLAFLNERPEKSKATKETGSEFRGVLKFGLNPESFLLLTTQFYCKGWRKNGQWAGLFVFCREGFGLKGAFHVFNVERTVS
jgi:hypothetical protein